MNKNRKVFIIILVVILAFGAGLGWRWVQGTPYYALYQIGAGLKPGPQYLFNLCRRGIHLKSAGIRVPVLPAFFLEWLRFCW